MKESADLNSMVDYEPDFDYESVEESLVNAECETNASQLQAFLCGMLVAGLKKTDNSWITHLIEVANEGHPLPIETLEVVQKVFDWTALLLEQKEFITPMLFPDDTYPAIDQMEAIITWCEGFLLGFGLQTGSRRHHGKELNESLSDLTEITRLDMEVEDNEETEEALLTVKEHIKVAVQVIFCETDFTQKQSPVSNVVKNNTIH